MNQEYFRVQLNQTARFKIQNRRGLHARAAAKFVHVCEQFDCAVTVSYGRKQVSGRSIMGLLMLGAAMGSEISVETTGDLGPALLADLENLINNCFDEEELVCP